MGNGKKGSGLTLFQQHVKRYRRAGRPGTGPLWTMDMVPTEELVPIQAEALRASREASDPHHAYAEVLASYGIVCPHPLSKRMYEGGMRAKHFPLSTPLFYHCEMCKCSVINEHRGQDEQTRDVGADPLADRPGGPSKA